jgi:cytochrome c biogenesis protein CcmG/thiol:disulfide interchange protein DsbE
VVGVQAPGLPTGPVGAPPVARGHRRLATVLVGATILVAVLLAALLLWPASAPGAASPVSIALPFQLADVRAAGGSAGLDSHPGRPVVLNFFAAWCDPCHAELPLLGDLQRRMTRAGSPLQVIGVDVQDNRDLAVQLLSDAKADFPAGYDPRRDVSGAWGVDGLPVTVFIAPDGKVIDYHRGQLRSGDLDRRVKALLSLSGGLA